MNLSAPAPVPFGTFVDALGRSVHRPAFLPVPAFAARFVGGEMAEEMILFSQRVVPGVLTDNDFTFDHPDIDSALEYTRG